MRRILIILFNTTQFKELPFIETSSTGIKEKIFLKVIT